MESAMSDGLYPKATPEMSKRRKELAPEVHDAFTTFSKAVFADGALPGRTKQLIAVAVAHVTQCPYCIDGHTKNAVNAGASEAELAETAWVASAIRAGGAYAHGRLAFKLAEGHQH